MNLGFVQYDIIWESPEENKIKVEELLSKVGNRNLDLLLLPEMFSTGFSMNTKKNAETMEGDTISWMKELACKLNAVVAGSLIIQEEDKYFNRLIWMKPDGDLDFYDKRHLFTLAKEDRHFSSGVDKKIFEISVGEEIWKVCPQICYDLRFPVFSRNVEEYDLLFYVANFPEKRSYAWSQLLVARAIENQCYVVGVNRIGVDGIEIPYSGGSVILDYEGRPIVDAGFKEGIFSANVVKNKMVAYRRAYNFLADRDNFKIT